MVLCLFQIISHHLNIHSNQHYINILINQPFLYINLLITKIFHFLINFYMVLINITMLNSFFRNLQII